MNTDKKKRWYWIGGLLLVLILPGLFFFQEITSGLMTAYRWISDREQMEQFIGAFGKGAPVAFMAMQVLQVILAPVPGEATGFVGGYLFGTVKGFVYSSIALSIGSWINFGIGRFVGDRFVRRWIPASQLERFDHLVKRQGIIVLFILFLFPGFPKDYLCLFLGITSIPLNIFLLIASIGRMPGTLMLSLQGEFVFQQNYTVFAIVFGVMILAAIICIRYRERIYKWTEKLNRKPASTVDPDK